MIFSKDLTVPANTPATAPVSAVMQLSQGIVHRVEVGFPAGCHAAVLVTINRAIHQVWPDNPDGALKGDNWTISVDTWYELDQPPYELTVLCWSPGTTYEHTVTVRLVVDRREDLQPPNSEAGILTRIARTLWGSGA